MSELDNFERMIVAAQAGELELGELIEAFVSLTVLMPSQSDPNTIGVSPVFVDVEGVPYVVVAAGVDALPKTSALAEYAVTLPAKSAVAGVAPGLGLLVNTVHNVVSFAPEILADLRDAAAQERGRSDDQ